MDTIGGVMATPEEFYKPNEQLLENLAKFVRNYRHEHNLTQRQLADMCSFHYKFIQTLETKKRNVSISAFVQLAEGLDTNLATY
jgi:transcriptional regulator with XRE-family HTH domain